MRVLFVAGGSAATVFALAPLATAARNAGHEVFVASTEEMAPYIASVGLPPVPVTNVVPPQYMFVDRAGNRVELPQNPHDEMRFAGRGFGRLAVASLPALMELTRVWRPDVVVGGSLAYSAGILAARLSVPFVRHAWDPSEPTGMDEGAAQELRPELSQVELTGLPHPDLYIDICPPSLRPPDAPPVQLMRWIPANRQRPLEPWMYTRCGRTRVCLTSGSRAADGPVRARDVAFLRDLAETVTGLDAEVVVAAPEGVADDLRTALPGLRIGWLPLDVVARTSDLVVHHGGGVTSMTAMNAGLPQLVIPQLGHSIAPARRLAAYGAAIALLPEEATAATVADACRLLLTEPSYRQRAGDLRREIAAQPLPSEVVTILEKL